MLSYLAGVLDVSGSLIITQRKGRVSPRVMLVIQHMNPALAQAFSDAFGGKVYQGWDNDKNRRERWMWQKTGVACQAVLRQLRPYMRIRGAEFDRLLETHVKPRGGSKPKHGMRVKQKPVVVHEPVRMGPAFMANRSAAADAYGTNDYEGVW